MQHQSSHSKIIFVFMRERWCSLVRPFSELGLILAFLTVGAASFAQGVVEAPKTPAPPSTSAASKAVQVELSQHKVIRGADGKEQLVDAASVKPGDVLEYRAVYVNRSAKGVTGLVADLPIPNGLEYQPKSAKPGAALVKVATGDHIFAAEPLMRKVGASQQLVPYGEYRKLRWALGQLPAGGTASVSARAQVQSYVAPSASELAASPQAPPVTVSRASSAVQ